MQGQPARMRQGNLERYVSAASADFLGDTKSSNPVGRVYIVAGYCSAACVLWLVCVGTIRCLMTEAAAQQLDDC